jgi:HEPN domain-containing protein
MNEELKQWFDKANEDYCVALELLKTGSYNGTICFHCQQSIEKYLKAFLFFKGEEIKKTHILDFLLNRACNFDSDFCNIETYDLDQFAVDIRYPGDLLVPTNTETNEFIEVAKQIKSLVETKINI